MAPARMLVGLVARREAAKSAQDTISDENGGVGVQDFEPVQQNYEKALQLPPARRDTSLCLGEKCIATLGQGCLPDCRRARISLRGVPL